jgi:hypothetical protein
MILPLPRQIFLRWGVEIDTSRQWLWQRPDRLVHRHIHISQIFHPARQTIHLYFSVRGLRIYYLYIVFPADSFLKALAK